MILWKFLGPPNLAKTLAFYVHETIKVIVINKYKNFVFATF